RAAPGHWEHYQVDNSKHRQKGDPTLPPTDPAPSPYVCLGSEGKSRAQAGRCDSRTSHLHDACGSDGFSNGDSGNGDARRNNSPPLSNRPTTRRRIPEPRGLRIRTSGVVSSGRGGRACGTERSHSGEGQGQGGRGRVPGRSPALFA
ncbi:unnamed protein product, partial [Hapterophycus canaliculatus]